MPASIPLILASTSPYRRRLLERLGLEFSCKPPLVNETPRAGEAPIALAARLAMAKAEAIALERPGALVIGSDQVAEIDGQPVGKPGDFKSAREQLQACSGRRLRFHTGLALVGGPDGISRVHVEPFAVRFRGLDDDSINRYLRLEEPYDCAGSFKAEGLGISLFEALEGRDPTSLEGLPLMALCTLLRDAGLDPLG